MKTVISFLMFPEAEICIGICGTGELNLLSVVCSFAV
jgi:hypothetical protein